MTYASHPVTTSRESDTAWHVTTTIVAVVGILAVALGLWMEYWTDAGTMTLFGWTWDVADLSDLWAPLLMLVGGLLAALPMGTEAIRDWDSSHSRWLIVSEAFIGVVGLAAAILGVILLF